MTQVYDLDDAFRFIEAQLGLKDDEISDLKFQNETLELRVDELKADVEQLKADLLNGK